MIAAIEKIEIPDVNDASDFRECLGAFRPTKRQRLIEWAVENIVNDQGRPFDHAAYPHIGAPGGPADAFDDPAVRTISEQFATRLSKTFFGQVATLYTAYVDPAPQMFCSAAEKLSREITERTYTMIRKRPQLNRKLAKSEKFQRGDCIDFKESRVFVAWARSPATLADKNIKIGHANEIDKWEQRSTSKEAAPLKLFSDRFKDYQSTRKLIFEGTPTVKGRSPIERLRLAGWNCFLFVPCPHCKKYQKLEFGDGETKHGVKFDSDAAGRTNPETARATARYVCRHCEKDVLDHSRAWMVRRGVWIPEGCKPNDKQALKITEKSIDAGRPAWDWNGWKRAKWIKGNPARDGIDASYQLSSLYALSLSWGDIAKEFVDSKGKPQELRNFKNQWLGETWEIAERRQTWETLGQKIIIKTPALIIPEGYSVITSGIDKQADYFVYVVNCWASGRSVHTLDYGSFDTLDDLKEILDTKYEHADGGDPLGIAFSLIDSGYRPADVYQFCNERKRGILACKGSSSALNAYYSIRTLGKKSSSPGQRLVLIDTTSTQDFIDNQLHSLKPEDVGGRSLFDGSVESHQDYLEQMLNDASIVGLDGTNNVKETWQRLDENIPNDYRDCERYSFAAMLATTRGAAITDRRYAPKNQQRKPRPAVTTPDGRPFLITER